MVSMVIKLFIILIIGLGSSIFLIAASATPLPDTNCTIYFASSLFSGRDKEFNIELVNNLEEDSNIKVTLPQREGFEFAQLSVKLRQYLKTGDVSRAMQLIIYYLDLGVFLKNSNIVIAVLDEPLDPGVLIEIAYAKMMGKYVIGIRSDIRSPYNHGGDPTNGLHLFTIFQLNDFVFFIDKAYSISSNNKYMRDLSNFLDARIVALNQKGLCNNITHSSSIKDINDVETGANILFHNIDIKNIRSSASLKIIMDRYLANEEKLNEIYPAMSKIK